MILTILQSFLIKHFRCFDQFLKPQQPFIQKLLSFNRKLPFLFVWFSLYIMEFIIFQQVMCRFFFFLFLFCLADYTNTNQVIVKVNKKKVSFGLLRCTWRVFEIVQMFRLEIQYVSVTLFKSLKYLKVEQSTIGCEVSP